MKVSIGAWSFGDAGTPAWHLGVAVPEFNTAFSLGKDNGNTSTGDVDGEDERVEGGEE